MVLTGSCSQVLNTRRVDANNVYKDVICQIYILHKVDLFGRGFQIYTTDVMSNGNGRVVSVSILCLLKYGT